MNTNKTWKDLLNKIVEEGETVVCRGHEILELRGHRSVIDMKYPLITTTYRKLGYRFACAEAATILSGDNKVSTLTPYSSMINKFSDDKMFFFGAYGPKIVDQLEYIGRTLKNDIYSRQAVLTIWREKPPVSNDIPCTIAIQFLVREGELHLFDTMRSSDTWLGVPYDWFTFSMLAGYVILYLKEIANLNLKLGKLYFYSGSQHLYTKSFGYTINEVKNCICHTESDFDYAAFDPSEFDSPQMLIEHLWSLARDKKVLMKHKWLKELQTHWESK